ncbi:MAG TPA: hybrid sensor histidine kinase/response regulator [Pseudolabrys sp.]|nr:hybrid sensor histidine kinase/response regulator [Pseudolabrys sp.]
MDDLLREFVTETNESLDVVDVELVRFEQDPNNAKILDNIFRLVHTIKGTCGFLGLPRLEALAHAAETLMGKFRDGAPASSEAVTLILVTIDRIKTILESLETDQREPEGTDTDLIISLERMVERIGAGGAQPGRQAAGAPQVRDGGAPARGVVPGDHEGESRAGAAEGGSERAAKAASGAVEPGGKDDEAAKSVNQTIRVTVDTLEQLMTMVSELVLTRNQLLEIVRRHEESEFKAPLQRLSNVTAELQEGVMKTRMQPIGNAWQKLPRIVRDLSNELGKKIELEMQGADTELDRQVLDLIKDPLTHMVRNSADHGLESPDERRAAGKPEHGLIRLSAYHEGGYIIIRVADDGRGLDTERIKAKAVAQGLVSESDVEKLPEAQIHKFIFSPGFSTAARITSVSGRGVGMDVVRNNIDQIGGTIDVKSVAGAGLSFTIKIPLTLAIVAALIVEAGGHRFAIPQLSVVELVRARGEGEHRIERIKDTRVLRLRDKLLPLVSLRHLFGLANDVDDINGGYIVVTQVGSQSFGIVVDGVFHTEEIVVKPMSSKLRHIAMFSGNTILGDGSVIMIIDPNGVAQAFGTNVASQLAAVEASEAKPAAAVGGATTSLLVFRAGSMQPKAVPLSLITRLEEIDARKIELSNGRHMVQYRGHLMPLISIGENVRVKGEGAQPLLVFSDGSRSMAIVVDEIVDIVDDNLDIQVASDTPGVLGSAVVRGQATEIIDVGHFLPLAFEDWFRRKEPQVQHRPRSVLLVDDSPFFLNMLTPVLQAAGYSVTACASARDALTLLAEGRPFDVAITDIEMPDMNGFEFAEAVRADPRTADLPIIALSSVVSPEAIERGRRVGFHDYVAKFDRQGLIAALKEQTGVVQAA